MADLTVNYSNFYTGISQDDIISPKPQILEGNNVTGLTTGFGLTLGHKPTKIINTSQAIYGVAGVDIVTGSTSNTYFGGVGGVIYHGTGVDLTPIYTLPSGNTIIGGFFFADYYRFITRDAIVNTTFNIANISLVNVNLGNWGNLTEHILTTTASSIGMPPVLIYGAYVYIGANKEVIQLDIAHPTTILHSLQMGTDYVTGLTIQGSTIKVYSYNGQVYYWDGIITNPFSSVQDLGKGVREVSSQGRFDYITFNDGSVRRMAGWQDQSISERKFTNRGNDNTLYQTKLSLAPPLDTVKGGNTSVLGKYYLSNDTQPGIYIYDQLMKQLPHTFHKFLTTSSQGVINELTFIYLNKRTATPRFYYGYRSGANYGIDYIDEGNLATARDGYAITQIFRGPPNKINKIKHIKLTTSYTNGNNYVKISKRINNGPWVLFRTINEATNTIKREKITNQNDEFMDIQFKIELHNDLQTNFPPIVNGFELTYNIIKE